MDLFSHIPEQALTITHLYPGGGSSLQYGASHTKIAYCTIIAQAVQGGYELECERGRGKTYGGLFLAQAGEFLKIWHHGDGSNRFTSRSLHITITLYDTVDAMSLFEMPVIVDTEQAAPFTPLLEELYQLRKAGDMHSFRMRSLAYQVLELVCSNAELKPEGEAMLIGLPRLAPLLSLLDRDYREDISVEQMAGELFISRSRLFSLFQELLRCSPMEYLKRVRIRKATTLLVSTDLPVYDIAEKVGFENPYHFGREFKKVMDISPGRYRNNYL